MRSTRARARGSRLSAPSVIEGKQALVQQAGIDRKAIFGRRHRARIPGVTGISGKPRHRACHMHGIRPARRERRQAVRKSGAIALRTRPAAGPCRFQFAAWRGPFLVDAAGDLQADVATERNAMRPVRLRAAHDQAMRIECLGQFRGRSPAAEVIGLRPVERHAEMGATGAARQTGMAHGRPGSRNRQCQDIALPAHALPTADVVRGRHQ
jgi:hypothetical protein